MTTKPLPQATARHRHARAIAAGGYTREQVRRGEFPPILSLLPRALAAEVRAARLDGAPLYTQSK